MLGEIFYWIFNMSIAATICMVPVLLLRLIKKKPPSNFHLAVACAVYPDVYSCWNFKQIQYYGFTFQVYN